MRTTVRSAKREADVLAMLKAGGVEPGDRLSFAMADLMSIFGPVLGSDHSTFTEFVQRMMNGAMPGLPRLSFGVVDARDVADLHVRAMTNPAAKGERFLAVSGDFMTVREIAQTLKTRLGDAAARVTTRELPDWLVRIVGLFNPEAAQLVTELGKVKNATNAKAVRGLGWAPRSCEDALAATGESLVRLGLLKK